MNMLVIGANGAAGQLITKEALKKGHTVTGLVRREGAVEGIPTIVKDALELTKEEILAFDVVINATSAFSPETFTLHETLTNLLVSHLKGSSTRLFVVGGAGSLYVDETHTTQLYDTPEFPAEFLGLAKAQGKAIEILRRFSDVNWTFFSPAAEFDAKGPLSNDYVLGGEEYIENKDGQSYLSYATYAKITVDELENKQFERRRFTAVQ